MSINTFSATVSYVETQLNGYLFGIENSLFSRSKINMKRFVCQVNNSNFFATGTDRIMPLFKTYKVSSSLTGGIETSKIPFDTLYTSDTGIRVLRSGFLVTEGADLSTGGGAVSATYWQQFTSRMITGIGQVLSWDFLLLPTIVDTSNFCLLPGESLIVQNQSPIVENGMNGATCIFMVAWEEDDAYDVGYTISGNVKLSGADVYNAKVIVVTDTDENLPSGKVEVIETDINGNWSKPLASAVKASAFVQHKAGTDLYTDEGKPFLEKV